MSLPGLPFDDPRTVAPGASEEDLAHYDEALLLADLGHADAAREAAEAIADGDLRDYALRTIDRP